MKKSLMFTFVSLVAIAGHAVAQSNTGQSGQSPAGGAATQPPRAGAQAGSQASGQASQGNALAKHIAVCLVLGNQEEVALGQFAQDRAQNEQVKQFAQMMAEEHEQANAKIKQAVPEIANMDLKLTATEGRPGSASGQSPSGNQRQSASGSQTGGQDQQMVQFAKEVKQECLNLTQAMLGEKQGAEFDKAYIGQQLVAHTGMLATLKASQKHASGQLQPILQEGTQMTEHHIAQAKQIMEQLGSADGATAGQARRPGAPGAATPPRR